MKSCCLHFSTRGLLLTVSTASKCCFAVLVYNFFSVLDQIVAAAAAAADALSVLQEAENRGGDEHSHSSDATGFETSDAARSGATSRTKHLCPSPGVISVKESACTDCTCNKSTDSCPSEEGPPRATTVE